MNLYRGCGVLTTLISLIGSDSDEWDGVGKKVHLWCCFRERVQKEDKEDGGLAGTT